MKSLPEFDIFPETDYQHTPTGRWCWEIFDAASQGPIEGGVERSKQMACTVGAIIRNRVETNDYC